MAIAALTAVGPRLRNARCSLDYVQQMLVEVGVSYPVDVQVCSALRALPLPLPATRARRQPLLHPTRPFGIAPAAYLPLERPWPSAHSERTLCRYPASIPAPGCSPFDPCPATVCSIPAPGCSLFDSGAWLRSVRFRRLAAVCSTPALGCSLFDSDT